MLLTRHQYHGFCSPLNMTKISQVSFVLQLTCVKLCNELEEKLIVKVF